MAHDGQAIITVGVSASGKSTYAAGLVAEGWVEANRDNIRFQTVCPGGDWRSYSFTKEKEKLVTLLQQEIVQISRIREQNIIISDTNLNRGTRDGWVERLEGLGYAISIVPMHISLEEAIARDSKRGRFAVGEAVIRRQYQQWLQFISEETKWQM